jgi:hypothetical protein
VKLCNWFCVVAILLYVNASGQTLRRPIAASYTGLGAYSINHSDIFSFTANQASLAQLKTDAVAVYGERRFLLNELNSFSGVAGVVTSSGNFGLKATYSGFSEYNESQLGLAYGRKLGKKIDVGVQFNYNSFRMSSYGNAAAISFEVGTVFHITEKLHAGIHINNPVGGKFGKAQEEKLSSVYTAGFGYEASEKFFFSTEIVKEEDQPVNVNTGLQYKIIPQLFARMGVSSATSSGWLGVGMQLRSFRIDVSASYHQQLGITPGLLLLYNFNKTNK